ncbi:MAG: di-heme oxidoredictase family protein [Pseudomonadota bacterium]
MRVVIGALAVGAFGFAMTASSADRQLPHLELLPAGGSALTSTVSMHPSEQRALTLPLAATPSTSVSVGAELFKRNWFDESDADVIGSVALGPSFDASSCVACHVEVATQPRKPAQSGMPVGVVARTVTAQGRQLYGDQVNTLSIDGTLGEARVDIEWQQEIIRYSDGTKKQLRRPIATAVDRQSGQQEPVALRSPPLLFGWGLMIAADPAYLDHFDGHVDVAAGKTTARSRFTADGHTRQLLGWKNAHATLESQVATAFAEDMGIASDIACAHAPCQSELTAEQLGAVVAFVRWLPVPEQRPGDVDAYQRGEQLFGTLGCNSCHVPILVTKPSTEGAFSNQTIWPYTDLMLHDMGSGLADPGEDPLRAEWRTAPLWSIGLVERFRPEHGFLHDGRARDIEEAILWHGGEATRSQRAFRALPKDSRSDLLAYLRAL